MSDYISITFDTLRKTCKWYSVGYDEYKYPPTIDTCRKSKNTPQESSWGECNQDDCPLIK